MLQTLHIYPLQSFLSTGKRQTLLDLSNGERWVETLGAYSRAVENGVASVQAHAVVQSLLPLLCALVSAIGEPSVRLEKNGWAEVFLAVPPVRRAGGRAAGAQNALVKTIELLALGNRLSVLPSLS